MRGMALELQEEDARWQPLRFFNLYRLVLASLFLLMTRLDELPPPLGMRDPELFEQGTTAYLIFSLLTIYTLHRQQPGFLLQLYGVVFTDIVLLTLLMHASGGVGSGLGMLLVVSIANGSMISAERVAGLFAALATIAVLLEQTYSQLWLPGSEFRFPQAGLLGATLFATAVLAHVLARRARRGEALARQRGLDLENMAQLTDHIIQRMLTGVIALNSEERIRLANLAALDQLGAPTDTTPERLPQLSPHLHEALQRWRHSGEQPAPFNSGGQRLLPRFMGLGSNRREGTLIFLEDAERTTRQAQQLKLASLGRLTAGIAHEIRNPLAAISHAGELLGESPQLDEGDRRLGEIIVKQSQRMNRIIEDVLQLGRRDRSQPELFELLPWLRHFEDEFRRVNSLETGVIGIIPQEETMEVRFDRGHLGQILTNLCHNALRHTPEAGPDGSRLHLSYGVDSRNHPYLEVQDYGPGVSEEAQQHLFEPFFTTESSGTGLGLYISRELAECNHAQLEYRAVNEPGGHFRLTFADPQQQFE